MLYKANEPDIVDRGRDCSNATKTNWRIDMDIWASVSIKVDILKV